MPSISTQLANKGKSSSKVFGRMDGKLKKYTPVTGCILTNSHLNANDSGFGRTCRMSTRCEETRTARCSVCTSEQCKNCPSCSSDRVTHNCGNSHTVESSSHVCKEHSSRGHKRGFEPVDTRQAVAALKDLLNITGSVKSRYVSNHGICQITVCVKSWYVSNHGMYRFKIDHRTDRQNVYFFKFPRILQYITYNLTKLKILFCGTYSPNRLSSTWLCYELCGLRAHLNVTLNPSINSVVSLLCH